MSLPLLAIQNTTTNVTTAATSSGVSSGSNSGSSWLWLIILLVIIIVGQQLAVAYFIRKNNELKEQVKEAVLAAENATRTAAGAALIDADLVLSYLRQGTIPTPEMLLNPQNVTFLKGKPEIKDS